MSIGIDTIQRSFVQNYVDTVIHVAQQEDSLLFSTIMKETIVGMSSTVETLGKVTMQERKDRNSATTYSFLEHGRRFIRIKDFDVALLLDRFDVNKMEVNPNDPYVRTLSSALGRMKDQIIVQSLLGDAEKHDNTKVSLPSEQKIAHGNTGLTLDKLRSAVNMLRKKDVKGSMEEPYILAHTATQLDDMLSVTQVTSSDYNIVKSLVDGQLKTFMGVKFIMVSEDIIEADSSNVRKIPLYSKQACKVVTNEKFLNITIDRMPAFRNAWQFYACLSMAAVRTDEIRVVEIACQES